MTIVSNSFYMKSIIVENTTLIIIFIIIAVVLLEVLFVVGKYIGNLVENTKEEQTLISKEKSFQFKIKSELEIRIKNTRIINI